LHHPVARRPAEPVALLDAGLVEVARRIAQVPQLALVGQALQLADRAVAGALHRTPPCDVKAGQASLCCCPSSAEAPDALALAAPLGLLDQRAQFVLANDRLVRRLTLGHEPHRSTAVGAVLRLQIGGHSSAGIVNCRRDQNEAALRAPTLPWHIGERLQFGALFLERSIFSSERSNRSFQWSLTFCPR
jgi:hypothetical protein